MHQSLDHLDSPDAETAALRDRIRRALACDLQLPEQHPAVTATMRTLAAAAEQHAVRVAPAPVAVAATLDTWWCVVAHTRALTAR